MRLQVELHRGPRHSRSVVCSLQYFHTDLSSWQFPSASYPQICRIWIYVCLQPLVERTTRVPNQAFGFFVRAAAVGGFSHSITGKQRSLFIKGAPKVTPGAGLVNHHRLCTHLNPVGLNLPQELRYKGEIKDSSNFLYSNFVPGENCVPREQKIILFDASKVN